MTMTYQTKNLDVQPVGFSLGCHLGLDKEMSRQGLSGSGWEISVRPIEFT